jgi:hypothetical protein
MRAPLGASFADLYLASNCTVIRAIILVDSPPPEASHRPSERYEEDLTDASRPHPPLHADHLRWRSIKQTDAANRGADAIPLRMNLRRQLD